MGPVLEEVEVDGFLTKISVKLFSVDAADVNIGDACTTIFKT